MKFNNIFRILLASIVMTSAVASTAQNAGGDNSVLSSGHWVKIRVDSDGVYGLSETKLKELGFSDPSKVKVFGYEPTVLLDHNPNLVPRDLPAVQSVYVDGQLLFYVRGNVDLVADLWSTQKTTTYAHEIHSHSTGATYFLTDIDFSVPAIPTAEKIGELTTTVSEHSSVIFYEDEHSNYANGGTWFLGESLTGSNSTEIHKLELKKIANISSAEMFYTAILSPEVNNANNYVQASYDNGVTVSSNTGSYARAIDAHEVFRPSMRLQKLHLPDASLNGDLTVNVSFSLNPSSASMLGPCALDYFMLKYRRLNDLSAESQVNMYFENREDVNIEFTGADTGNWQVWNVTNPSAVQQIQMEVTGDDKTVLTGQLKTSASTSKPNVLVAFRTDVAQPEPEIIGEVLNQDLHSISVPDLLIVTTDVMIDAAEEVADFHKRHQNIEVAIVDQQQIFNEYSSGNTSPEGVRLFVNDLYKKDNQKLKAVLLLGPATFRNAQVVAPGSAEVVASENEDYSKSAKETHNFCSDAFFGYIGGPVSSGNWASRHRYYKVFGNTVRIPVGRLPYNSIDDVRSYYRKAEDYITNPPTTPSYGNIVLASDFAYEDEAAHMYDACTLATALGSLADSEVTVAHAASNLFSSQDNTITRRIMLNGVERGALMKAYFGHGDLSQIGGSNTTRDFLLSVTTSDIIKTPGRHTPIYFYGSCYVGAFDRTQSNLSSMLLKNEFGGPMAMISSTRSVYQPENRALGQAVVKELYAAKNGAWLGEVWRNALVFSSKDVIDYICNQLSYNFLGDPALPLYSKTNSVNITSVNGDEDALIALSNNEVAGEVVDSNGNVDSDFNGNVILTVYDVPQTYANVLKATEGKHSTYRDSVATDFSIIGEYNAAVKNGKFVLNFNGPVSSKVGTHRIQAYAYSADGIKRGIGYKKNLELNNGAAVTAPEAEPIQITSFVAGEGSSDELFTGKCVLRAEISAPTGLAGVGSVQNPARLVVDGVTYTNVARLMNFMGDSKYTLEYPISNLSLGKHKASLMIQDSQDNWAVSEIEFVSMNAPEAELSVIVEEQNVIFDITSALAAADSSVLVVETLSGEPVMKLNVESFPVETTLQSGAYRAFVQQQAARTVTSTPKVELFVD